MFWNVIGIILCMAIAAVGVRLQMKGDKVFGYIMIMGAVLGTVFILTGGAG